MPSFLQWRAFFYPIFFICKPWNLCRADQHVSFVHSLFAYREKATKNIMCSARCRSHLSNVIKRMEFSSFGFHSLCLSDSVFVSMLLLYHSVLMLNLIVFKPMLCVTSNKVTIWWESRKEFDLCFSHICARADERVCVWSCVLNVHLCSG